MKRPGGQIERIRPALLGCMLVAWLGMGLTCWSGCRRSETPPSSESEGKGSSADGDTSTAEQLQPSAGAELTSEDVLKRMVEAYKDATSYADQGSVQLKGQRNGQPLEMPPYVCLVAMVRPNKVRMLIDDGALVCDGEHLWAFVMSLPGQILRRQAPAKITIDSLYPDYVLGGAMMQSPAQSFAWVPLQAILLLADDPLKTLLHGAEEAVLLDPAKIEDYVCHRVQVRGRGGTGVFWIDQRTHVLRRFEFPIAAFDKLAVQDQVKNVSLVAEYHNAQLNTEVDPRAFQFQAPPETAFVENFIPPLLQILGQQAPDLEFVDLEGNSATLASLAGKVVVIDMWETTRVPCRHTLPEITKVYQKYKDNDKVAFLAVSIDGPNVENKTLQDVFADWGVELPIFRDPQQRAFAQFGSPGVPLSIIVGPKGRIQSFQPGGAPGIGAHVSAGVENLLAGVDIFREAFRQFEMGKAQFDQLRQYSIDLGVFALPEIIPQEIPRAEILERTEPTALKITRLWSCTELEAPGNILVVPRSDRPPKLLVLNKLNSVAEIGPDGQVITNHQLETRPGEPVMFLRTASGDDGRRYFVGSARGVQHFYLLDESFKTLLSYPEAPHRGIGDVRLTDLDGDGTLEIAVGYFDVVGVQAVSLEGERIWANRELVNAFRIAVLAPDSERHRSLMCLNASPDRGTLVTIDWEGKREGQIVVPDRSIGWITDADLDGDEKPELCALAELGPGKVVAIGLNRQGEELWTYPLPSGIHHQQIEPVTSGNVFADGPGQWLLASADGTIHILGADGQLVDRFVYGAELSGLATAKWDGKAVLLVATTESVDAWEVQPPAKP